MELSTRAVSPVRCFVLTCRFVFTKTAPNLSGATWEKGRPRAAWKHGTSRRDGRVLMHGLLGGTAFGGLGKWVWGHNQPAVVSGLV